MFQQVKNLLTQERGPVMTYFDHTKDVKLQVDASKCGLRTVLLQGEKPATYAFKLLWPNVNVYRNLGSLRGKRRFIEQ